MILGGENVVKPKVTQDESDKLKEKSTDILHDFIGVGQCHLHPTHSSDLCYRCTARNPAQAASALTEGAQPRDAQPGGVQPGHAQGTFWSNI